MKEKPRLPKFTARLKTKPKPVPAKKQDPKPKTTIKAKPQIKPKKKQVQPKKHAAKNPVTVKARRKKIVKDLMAGKTMKQAGIDAGLSPKTAESQVSRIVNEPQVKECFKAMLDRVVPDQKLVNKYDQLLDATKVISAMVVASNGEGMKNANSMTRDFIDVPDFPTQLRTADSIARLKGHLVDKDKGGGLYISNSNVILGLSDDELEHIARGSGGRAIAASQGS